MKPKTKGKPSLSTPLMSSMVCGTRAYSEALFAVADV
eukprot:CAMPEP_0183388976 /NCGR_PEP_ID=MMETSP0370-20130417/4574_1 /TAXON_ID=268820 /ORGANISM="Peridinium aciculiferum, Strain PAER-2" /LENGTH=36 /DNA_ID= /DNA_START= /DNA_END= /DNA_ORIENTATION=